MADNYKITNIDEATGSLTVALALGQQNVTVTLAAPLDATEAELDDFIIAYARAHKAGTQAERQRLRVASAEVKALLNQTRPLR